MKLNYQDWIAPERYNITSEMEKHPPERLALKWLDEAGNHEDITYGSLLEQANRLANGLKQLGLKQGDKVLVMVPRQIIAYVIYLACLKSGIIIIPSSEMLRAKDLAYRLRNSGARAVIAWSSVASEVDSIDEQLPDWAWKIAVSADPTEASEGWHTLHQLMEQQPSSFNRCRYASR